MNMVVQKTKKKFNSLTYLNDNENTWLQIADHLEKYPKQYFTHSV